MVNLKDWKILTIEELTKIFTKQTGFDYTAYIKPTLSREYKTGYIPFIQNKDFNGKFINYDTDYFIPYEIARNFPRILLDEKCLLISISGSVGNVAVFNSLKTAFIGGAIAIGKFKDKELLDWCMYYLMSRNGQNKLLSNVKAGSHQNLILDDLRNIEIPIPPKEEQKAIAKALSDTDELITTLEKLISKKEAIKQGTMQQLLTGKKRLSGFSGEWEEKKLGDISSISRGASPRPIEDPKWFDNNSDIGWVRISDISKTTKFLNQTVQKLSQEGVSHSRFVKKENLIMSICATLGKPILTKLDTCIHDGFVVFNNLQIDKEFLYYFLFFIEKDWSKSGQTGSQMNLNTELINSTTILLPPTIKEQQSIVEILSDMDNEIESLKSKLSKTKAIKDGIMSELLTGKTRLKVKDE